jgi:hypothetical protein
MSLKLKSSGGGSVTLADPASTATDYTQNLPLVNGNVLVSTAVSASVANTVTNKVAINIGGTTYYLLASTSGA